ncbi:hypothetical protein HD553DRAFT_317641 [Filobasidium floriforme]|uniref:uncharacterized protein n=1 Tax=Filobasidium floriforme TaxID=5210 RepID=UPI001E8DE420|nr:uncharacterized protein HD553DRAFT_317641 [Filobasidium floriforme]KAH8080189.1 hypothetical protein HD553DRAFT_317641 [Filobasidium floriforme]
MVPGSTLTTDLVLVTFFSVCGDPNSQALRIALLGECEKNWSSYDPRWTSTASSNACPWGIWKCGLSPASSNRTTWSRPSFGIHMSKAFA